MEQEFIRVVLGLGLIILVNLVEFMESGLFKRKYNIKRVVISCIIIVLIIGVLPILF